MLFVLSEDTQTHWRIALFGAMEIHSPTGQVTHVTGRKSAELIAFLSLRRHSIVDRDAIVEALWPDADEVSGRNRLKQLLAVVRRDTEGLPIQSHGKNEIELDPSAVEIDFQLIEQRLKWISALPEKRRKQACLEILNTIDRSLLPGLSAPWLLADRIRYEGIARDLTRQTSDQQPLAELPFRFGDDFAASRIPLVGRRTELAAI